MSLTVKKIQLVPLGEKEERDRVYKYLRDAIYNQHHILNTYMSQVGTLYYSCNKDYKSVEFKEGKRNIFRNTNTAIHDLPQAKGLGMAGACGRRVDKDFSTALKNGLAKGERRLPFYKRDFPLLTPGRFIRFYTTEYTYTDDNGEPVTKDIYAIKFVNGINFRVVLGSKGDRDLYLTSVLDGIVNKPDKYSVRDSSISMTNKGKIILNLTVRIDKEEEKYEAKEGRIMGLALGYDKCLVAALSDSDKAYGIGDYLKNSIVDKRIEIQEFNQHLQKELRYAKGGHGRKKKLRNFNERGSYEKNYMQNCNHKLSKSVVEFAKSHKVECIVVEKIEKEDLEKHPVLLRNWSYYQLVQFITYKAEKEGIKVVEAKEVNKARKYCCGCGCELKGEDVIPKEIEWQHELSFTCPECGTRIEYSYNKAKNLTVMG